MIDFGYSVLWRPEKRMLSITSGKPLDKTREKTNAWSIHLYSTMSAPTDDNYEGFWLVWKRNFLQRDNNSISGHSFEFLSHIIVSGRPMD